MKPVAWLYHIKRTLGASVQSVHLAAIEYCPQENEEVLGKESLFDADQLRQVQVAVLREAGKKYGETDKYPGACFLMADELENSQ